MSPEIFLLGHAGDARHESGDEPVALEPVDFGDVSGEHRCLQPFLGAVQLRGEAGIGHGVPSLCGELEKNEARGGAGAATSGAGGLRELESSTGDSLPNKIVSAARCGAGRAISPGPPASAGRSRPFRRAVGTHPKNGTEWSRPGPIRIDA